MYRRRLTILLILAVVALLGFLLFANVRPSTLFRVAAPTPHPLVPTVQDNLKNLKNNVSSSIAVVSTTALLEQPRYTGRDSLGRNWLLTATKAGQEGSTTSGTYVLQQVMATWEDPSQTSPFRVGATQGRYTQVSDSLELSGDVSATGLGFNLTAPKVNANLVSRTLIATGGSHVVGAVSGKDGKGWDVNITAPTLNADQNSSRLLLTGGVHAIFTPTKSQ